MIDPRPTATPTAFFTAILTALRAYSWPSPIAEIGFREPMSDSIAPPIPIRTPALLLTADIISGLEDGDETLDQALCMPGRAARDIQCSIFCMLSTSTHQLPMQSIELSQSVFGLIESLETASAPRRGHQWGLGEAVEMPREIRDAPADLGLNGIETRIVSWNQVLYVPQVVRGS